MLSAEHTCCSEHWNKLRELLIPSFYTASEANRPLQQPIVEECPENLNKILNKSSGVPCYLQAASDQKQRLTCMDELSTWEVEEDEDGFQWSLFS